MTIRLSAKAAWAESGLRARLRRKRQPFDLRAIRIRDLNCLLDARYWGKVPNTPEGRGIVVIMANHLAMLPLDPRRRVLDWLRAAAPWYSLAEADDLLANTLPNPKRYKADTLAFRLKVTKQERALLGITTIGAYGQSAVERRKERARLRKEGERWLKGAKPRAEYEAKSLSRLKPWEAEGISRRTWYSRRK